jgi:hypothetical protein
MRDQRSGFPAPKAHRPEQALALAHSQFNRVALPQMVRQQSTIPQILPVPQIPRMQPQVSFELFPSRVVQTPRTTFPLAFAQATKAARLKPMHPTFHGGGMLPKPVGDLITAMALADQQDAVQPVIVTRLIGPTNLLLQRDSHGLNIGNLKSFHA